MKAFEIAALIFDHADKDARIAELTKEVYDLTSKLDFANAMTADQDKTVAGLTAERDRYKVALEKIVSETSLMTSTYDSAVNAHDIARNALKDGV